MRQHHDSLTPAGNPLPADVHLTVLSTDADDAAKDAANPDPANATNPDPAALRWLNPRGRLVVVGDVHGCACALDRLLRAVGFERGRDNLVLCGDLVTKGPDSAGVLDRAMALGALVARGNHDDLALAAASAVSAAAEAAAEAGARGTRAAGDEPPPPPPSPDYIPGLTDKHLQWLSSLPFTIRFPQLGVTVAHAGLVPGVPLRRQALRDVTRMRELVAVGDAGVNDGEDEGDSAGAAAPTTKSWLRQRRQRKQQKPKWRAVEAHEPGSVPWAPEWHGPGHVLFGHDSALGLQRTRAATGLDTGCVYGGQLTCAVLPPLDELLLSRQLEGRRRGRRIWWWAWRWLCCCWGVGSDALPRTPRFERDLRGRIVSVPSSSAP